MAYYLLGTQTLLNIALLDNGRAHLWYLHRSAQPGVFPDDIVISAFSVALIEAHFKSNPPASAPERQHLQNVRQLIKQFNLDGAIEGASPEVIEYWSEYLDYEIPYPSSNYPDDLLGFEEKFVLATAKKGNVGRGYILVDYKRNIHDQIGVLVESPYP